MNRKVILAGTLLLISIWHLPSTSHACTCLPPPPPARAVAEAAGVFVGQVISFEEFPAQHERLARFSVQRVWKRLPAEVDSIYTPLSEASCGYDFEVGETYLVYAFKDERGRMMTHLCSRTRPASFAQTDLNYLETFSLFPLAVGNFWQFENDKTESITDTLRLDGRLYFRLDKFREFNGALLRLSEAGQLYLRHDTLEQVWVDFNADPNATWHVKGPLNLGDEWDVQLVSSSDTVKTPAGTFFPCYRFYFRFAGADYDWDEWYFPNVGIVQRTLLGIAPFQFPLESAFINGKNYPTSVAEEPPSAPPHFFALAQNYPNPFVAALTAGSEALTFIHYSLQEPAEVELTIFDAMGKEIKTLARGYHIAGDHQTFWDGRNQRGEHASGGIYFYRLTVGSGVQVRKLILAR